jgi:hypothetical protein
MVRPIQHGDYDFVFHTIPVYSYEFSLIEQNGQ